jgi:hypothetical protein
LEPIGISAMLADRYLIGFRIGEICELGNDESGFAKANVRDTILPVAGAVAVVWPDIVMDAGFAEAELPAIAAAESAAANVFSQEFRTTGSLHTSGRGRPCLRLIHPPCAG